MVNCRFIALLLVLLIVRKQGMQAQSTVNAAGIVQGKVTTRGHEPLEYANVVVFSANDSSLIGGGITNKAGLFYITNIPFGTYYIVVKYIGYPDYIISSVRINNSHNKLGTIQLKQDGIWFDDVSIRGNAVAVQQQLDKQVLNTANDDEAAAKNAFELLSKAPAVSTDHDGNIAIRGNSDVVILVDGQPLLIGDNSALQSIPASSVEKVEIISNPSVKYQSEGTGGIINYVLKKNKKDNINALINTKWGTASKEHLDINLLYRKGMFNSHIKLLYNNMGRYNQSERTRVLYLDTTYYFRDDFYKRQYSNNDYITSIGCGLNLNHIEMFITSTYGIFELWRYKQGVQQQWNEYNPAYRFRHQTTSESLIHSGYQQYNFVFNYEFYDTRHAIENSLLYISEYNNDVFGVETTALNPVSEQTVSTEGTDSGQQGRLSYYRQKADYTFKIDTICVFNAGLYFVNSKRKSMFFTDDMRPVSNTLHYNTGAASNTVINQHIAAGYVNFKVSTGKLNGQVGLRYEYDNQDIIVREDTIIPFRGEDLMPALSFQYKFGKTTSISASYSKRKRLPQY